MLWQCDIRCQGTVFLSLFSYIYAEISFSLIYDMTRQRSIFVIFEGNQTWITQYLENHSLYLNECVWARDTYPHITLSHCLNLIPRLSPSFRLILSLGLKLYLAVILSLNPGLWKATLKGSRWVIVESWICEVVQNSKHHCRVTLRLSIHFIQLISPYSWDSSAVIN